MITFPGICAILKFMQVVMAIFSAGLLGLIIYFAFSPKSSRLLRRVAIIALVLIGLSLGICSIFLIMGPSKDPGDIPLPPFLNTPKAPAKKGNLIEILIFLVILALIMALITVLVRRDHRKKAEEAKKPKPQPAFQRNDKPNAEPEKVEEKNDDDSFDLGLD